MIKEWYSSKELTIIDGLPSTIQGINRKARVEKWRSRKRLGVQGKAIEYHINSFPDFVRINLQMRQDPNNHKIDPADFVKIWLFAYFQFTEKEREIILAWLLRHGLQDLLSYIVESQKK